MAELWQVIGASHRYVLAAYASSLTEDSSEQLLRDHGVTAGERTEVEAAIGMGFEQRLRRYQPVCLALWRRSSDGQRCEVFHREWDQHAHSPETAGAWLRWADLGARVNTASRDDEPSGSLSLLRAAGLPVLAWQRAREELGEPPHRFAQVERAYNSARDAVAGHLMAWFAYLVVPRASGSAGVTIDAQLATAIAAWVEQIRTLEAPSDVVETDMPLDSIIRRVSGDSLAIVPQHQELVDCSAVIGPLEALAEAAPLDICTIKLKDEPDKAAVAYERDPPALRSQQATATVDAVLRVAVALASIKGEQLNAADITDHALVTLLGRGTWANRVSVLAAMRYALEGAVPDTASRMKERQAFRDFEDWRTLWKKFAELGEIPVPPAQPRPRPTFSLLGAEWTAEDFEASAAAGPAGSLAEKLEAAVNQTIDVAAMRSVSRDGVQAPRRRGPRGAGGFGGGGNRVPDEYLKMIGAAGEYFAYRQLKVICPDFDIRNWVSRARERFGFEQGDDSLGYDFMYDDVTGALTGIHSVPRCFIEVKSTALGGAQAFPMSVNEWELAAQCHRERDLGTYLIIRIADVASSPHITDVLVDPVELHLQGVLDYSSRDLLVVLGAPR